MKGYKVLNLHTRKITVSRDVVFHEFIFPFSNSSHSLSGSHSSPLSGSSTPDFDSPCCPISILVPFADSTSIIKHVPNSYTCSDPSSPSSILIGSLLVPLGHSNVSDQSTIPPYQSNVHLDQSNVSLGHSSPFVHIAPPALSSSIPPLRKSTRISNRPAYLQAYKCNQVSQVQPSIAYPLSSYLSSHKLSPRHLHFCNAISSIEEPKFYHQAVKDRKWREAMATEISALEANHTWTLITLPPHKKTIGCKWAYRMKYKSDGTVEKYKARLMA